MGLIAAPSSKLPWREYAISNSRREIKRKDVMTLLYTSTRSPDLVALA
jgi:hypothetical protein